MHWVSSRTLAEARIRAGGQNLGTGIALLDAAAQGVIGADDLMSLHDLLHFEFTGVPPEARG
jgi:hypothetical protein